MANDIKNIIKQQKTALEELTAQIKAIEKSEAFAENQQKTEAYEKLKARYEKTERERQVLAAENINLKTALYEQYFNEKVQIVNRRQSQLDVFFADGIRAGFNRLDVIEKAITQRIESVWASLRANDLELDTEFHKKLNEIKSELEVKIKEARKRLASETSLAATEKEELNRLKQEPLSNKQIAELAKKNNLERLIGLNVLNIIGILLIIIGVVAAGRFAYLHMSDTWRSIALFALGITFLATGEILNRKKIPNVFSLGLTSGGAGILYASLAVSYFGLGVLATLPALIICIAITSLTFRLSTRHNSQVLLAIALAGGYLPVISIFEQRQLLPALMIYLISLNLLALLAAFRKKWTVASFTGLGFNILGAFYLSFMFWGRRSTPEPFEVAIHLTYLTIAMLTYTAIPLISTYAAKLDFKKPDVILVSINTFFGSLIIFANIASHRFNDFAALTPLALTSLLFTAAYWAIGYLTAKKFNNPQAMSALFYITSAVFFALLIPLQLGGTTSNHVWMTTGWAAQAVILAVYGILREERFAQRAGFIIGGLALLRFLFTDLGRSGIFNTALRFYSFNAADWQYTNLTAASLIIMSAFICNAIHKKAAFTELQKAFKYAVAVNLWAYSVFLINHLERILWINFAHTTISISHLISSLICAATLIWAMVLPRLPARRLPALRNKGMNVISYALYLIGIPFIFFVNLSYTPVVGPMNEQPIEFVVIAALILIALAAIGAFAVYDVTRKAVLGRVIGVQYLPLFVSAFIIAIFTVNLINAYGLTFASFWISIVYALAALLWTILGFVKRYALLRRFGLALALFTVAKLFLIDLTALTQGLRIWSYFIMGAILVAISYIYQYFNKRLELTAMPNNAEAHIVRPHETQETCKTQTEEE